MEIIVTDHFTPHAEPQTFSGSPMDVEVQLRDRFRSALSHIAFGDLYEIVRTLRAMTGIDLWVSEEPARIPIKRRKGMPPLEDPWKHDVDLPLRNSDDNL